MMVSALLYAHVYALLIIKLYLKAISSYIDVPYYIDIIDAYSDLV